MSSGCCVSFLLLPVSLSPVSVISMIILCYVCLFVCVCVPVCVSLLFSDRVVSSSLPLDFRLYLFWVFPMISTTIGWNGGR